MSPTDPLRTFDPTADTPSAADARAAEAGSALPSPSLVEAICRRYGRAWTSGWRHATVKLLIPAVLGEQRCA